MVFYPFFTINFWNILAYIIYKEEQGKKRFVLFLFIYSKCEMLMQFATDIENFEKIW